MVQPCRFIGKNPATIFILSSGEVTPFELRIIDRYSGGSRILSNLKDGCIRLAPG